MTRRSKTLCGANVFAGPDAIVHYLNPELHSDTSLVELPRGTKLNPFKASAKVRIFIKVMGAELPCNTFKLVPVFAWYEKQKRLGKINRKTIVVVNSSGGAGLAAVAVGRAMGVKEVRVYMPEDTPPDKQLFVKRAGGELVLTKDVPGKPTSVENVRKLAKKPNYLVFDQYGDEVNWMGHMKVTMRQIWSQMGLIGSFPGMIVAAKGTTGTLIAAREYAKARSSVTIVVGCECAENQPIPAVRPASRLGPDQILFDHYVGTRSIEVGRIEAYRMTVDLLNTAALKLGLSSGAALCGAIKAACHALGDLSVTPKLRDKEGFLNVVVVSGDILDPYINQLRVILDPVDL